MTRTLLLMRHAKAADFTPGRTDHERPLTDRGVAQAEAAGRWLATLPVPVDAVLCSTSVRTRQTLTALGLSVEPVFDTTIYNAAPEEIAAVLGLAGAAETLLVLGHAPGIPGLAADLADPERSAASALDDLHRRFPTAAIAQLRFGDDRWSDLGPGELTRVQTFD